MNGISVKSPIDVSIKREVLEMILGSARALHPRETVFLLRGQLNRNTVSISEVLVPPSATYGKGFAAFPAHMLPIDFSIVGTAHSHPSGIPTPSSEDFNRSMGRIILIVVFPYQKRSDVAAYDREGVKLKLQVT